MKKVHSAEQLFHLFCNMTNKDLEGFRTSSRNVYFQDGTLYSYGSHYPMAKKYSAFTGTNYKEIILINSDRSTVTTQNHKSQILSSKKPGQLVFYVPDIKDPKNKENQVELLNNIVDSIDAVIRRLKYNTVNDVTRAVRDYNLYAQAFKLKQFELPVDLYTDLAIVSNETEKRNEKKLEEQLKISNLQRLADKEKYKEQVKLWYTCENTQHVSWVHFDLDYDPVRINGEIAESNKNAKVDLRLAKNFCDALKQGRVQAGYKLGPFEVVSIDETFVQIGCHKINIKQAINTILGGQ